jgi:NAD(P)-dependent dehydrogenase (short-subunit alcohol dehydrogenase family)
MVFSEKHKEEINSEKIMIIGSNSDIGFSIIDILKANGKRILGVNRDDIDFNNFDSGSKTNALIAEYDPDVIINCVGVLGDNSFNYQKIFDVNFKPNWDIIQYFINNLPKKKVKFIMIGSSSYAEGRKAYMLYTASKAAIYSLFLSASSMFNETNLSIGLVNLPRVNTKMINNLTTNSENYLSARDAANIIIDFVNNLKNNSCSNIGVK